MLTATFPHACPVGSATTYLAGSTIVACDETGRTFLPATMIAVAARVRGDEHPCRFKATGAKGWGYGNEVAEAVAVLLRHNDESMDDVSVHARVDIEDEHGVRFRYDEAVDPAEVREAVEGEIATALLRAERMAKALALPLADRIASTALEFDGR